MTICLKSRSEVTKDTIVYTYTDEAPMLATYSFLPIIQCFSKACGVEVQLRDISVAGRVLAQFPDLLTEEQQCGDYLTELGSLCKTSSANVIKLPNISASIPQLEACIAELQGKGYKIPDYPANPKNAEEEAIKAKYAKVLGSAVNPVLREGNSDRRVAAAVKNYAQTFPHRLGKWETSCKSHVAHMTDGDFYSSEKSYTCEDDMSVRIEFVPSGSSTPEVLKDGLKLLKGEVIDCTRMSKKALRDYFEKEISSCKEEGLLLSLHMKATMMKISDPIIFGHCVEVYYKDVFEKYGDLFKELKISARSGLGDVYAKMKGHEKEAEVLAAIEKVYESRPALAMVDSDRGITNLHVTSDVIIDASMPVVVRDSGKMWCPDSKPGAKDSCLKETKCLIPDRSYAGIYKATLDFCRANGQFDVKTMGNVANVGLMAQKAEEYGSHDKTFEIKAGGGTVRVVRVSDNAVLMEQTNLGEGDIFRMCQTKDIAIRDWVKLAYNRARLSGTPVIFWLNPERAHDNEIKKKVDLYLQDHDLKALPETSGISIKDPITAINESMARAVKGENTISATGNVLRDYLTDLFPIIELGTSAKMLSIVPLLAGGCMFETGAGGSAPKHVQQMVKENHLRWDSLGEFLALAESYDMLGAKGSKQAKILAAGLHKANAEFLIKKECQVSRSAGELDNRGSHFYLAMYWAQALASQDEDPQLKQIFSDMYTEMQQQSADIVKYLNDVQKVPVDIGGYYQLDPVKAEAAMRPCKAWNSLLEKWGNVAAQAQKKA